MRYILMRIRQAEGNLLRLDTRVYATQFFRTMYIPSSSFYSVLLLFIHSVGEQGKVGCRPRILLCWSSSVYVALT